LVHGDGEPIDSVVMADAAEDLAPPALNKAYSAAVLQVATHQWRSVPGRSRLARPATGFAVLSIWPRRDPPGQ
jgi:hypothetical protein